MVGRFLGRILAVLLAMSTAGTRAASQPMGASVYPGGVLFRVWAPGVDSAAVEIAGQPAKPMTPEETAGSPALWTARVPGCKVGDRYRFLFNVAGTINRSIDPYARVIDGTSSDSWCVVSSRIPNRTHFRMPPLDDLVIYELHVGSFFADPATHQFSYRGVAGKLGYLKSLGINAIELMPLNLNPVDEGHDPPDYNWGYSLLSPVALKPSYGSPEDLKQLIRDCQARGIAVLIDVVYNHFSRGNLLERFAGVGVPGQPGGLYFYGGSAGRTPWGPRPDYSRPEVRQFLLESAVSLLREYGADGERWDSVDNIRQYQPRGARERIPLPDGDRLLQEFNEQKRAGEISIAEDLGRDPAATLPLKDGGLGFDTRWNNRLDDALRRMIAAYSNPEATVTAIGQALKLQFGDSVFRRVVYTEDHDTVGHPGQGGQTRLPSLIDPVNPNSFKARRLSTLANTIMLTAPGVPMLFQGEEMLDPRPFDFGRRTPVDWRLVEKNAGIVRLYRDLIALRHGTAPGTSGLRGEGIDVFHVNDAAKILAYRRFSPGAGGGVVVVANFSPVAVDGLKIGLPEAGRWHVRLDTADRRYSPSDGEPRAADPTAVPGSRDGMPFEGAISLAPFSAVILAR